MKLSVKAMAVACGVLWGGAVLLVATCNLIWQGYGGQFLLVLDSVYPGYAAVRTVGNVVVGTLYALVDGAIAGALLAWIYNLVAVPRVRATTTP